MGGYQGSARVWRSGAGGKGLKAGLKDLGIWGGQGLGGFQELKARELGSGGVPKGCLRCRRGSGDCIAIFGTALRGGGPWVEGLWALRRA